MTIRPHVTSPIEYGDAASFWVEYPSGLVDLTRHAHLPLGAQDTGEVQIPPLQTSTQLEIPVDGERVVRISKERSAIVIIDMQKCVRIQSAPHLLFQLLSECRQLLLAFRSSGSSNRTGLRRPLDERHSTTSISRREGRLGVRMPLPSHVPETERRCTGTGDLRSMNSIPYRQR